LGLHDARDLSVVDEIGADERARELERVALKERSGKGSQGELHTNTVAFVGASAASSTLSVSPFRTHIGPFSPIVVPSPSTPPFDVSRARTLDGLTATRTHTSASVLGGIATCAPLDVTAISVFTTSRIPGARCAGSIGSLASIPASRAASTPASRKVVFATLAGGAGSPPHPERKRSAKKTRFMPSRPAPSFRASPRSDPCGSFLG